MASRDAPEPPLDGRYQIERELGRGGMSTVHLATDLRYRRPVAIKVLDRSATAGVGVDRFLREVDIVSGLQHPYVLPLYDSGQAGHTLYFVMPYVPGGSLGARLRRDRQLPVPHAIRLACEAASALGYAHDRGVVHRDVKPENILLWAAHAAVADFGIGKIRVVDPVGVPGLTIPGGIVGTPTYMSPEQAAGEREIDGRSDLYSLACVLYEMLAGQPLFTGPNTLAVISQRFVEQRPALHRERADVPAHLDAALHRALAVAPDDRFGTAEEFIAALAPFGADTTTGGGHATAAAAAAVASVGTVVVAGAGRGAPAVAVVPFVNVSADPENEYLADGLTDEIIGSLSRLRTVRVAARTSSHSLKGTADDARGIARRLGADALLEGSVRRVGGHVRVTAQLVNAADGYQIWSERYDRPLDDVFAIQEDIARRIGEALEVTLLARDAGARGAGSTESVAAYDTFLQGRHWAGKRTEASIRRGIAAYEAAIAHDPRFARAYVGLSEAYAVLAIYGHDAPKTLMPVAVEAVARALALDPSLADAHASSGRIRSVYEWDSEGAERDFQRALALGQRSATAHHWYAVDYLLPRGRFAEATASIELACTLDPLSSLLNASVGLPWYFARQYAQAIAAYERALALDPGFGVTHLFLGQALVQAGRPTDAIAMLERAAVLIGPTVEVRAAVGHAYAVAGDRGRARVILDELLAESERRYVSSCLVAQIHAALGESDRALGCLERAAAERAVDLIWLPVRPTFDSLREVSGFSSVLSQLHLDGNER